MVTPATATTTTTDSTSVTDTPFTPTRSESRSVYGGSVYGENEGTPLDDDTWKWQLSPKREGETASKELLEEMKEVILSPPSSATKEKNEKNEIKDNKEVLKNINTKNTVTTKESSSVVMDSIVLVFFYFACLIFGQLYSGRYDFDCTENLPWVGKLNATNVVMAKLKIMEVDYENVLLNSKWEILKSEHNITIEKYQGEDKKAITYYRLTTILPNKPDIVYKQFKAEHFDTIMKAINPLYESSRLLFSPETKFFFPANGINIMKIVSKKNANIEIVFKLF